MRSINLGRGKSGSRGTKGFPRGFSPIFAPIDIGSSTGSATGSDCVLWLRADMGITTVDAAVASPNDLSTASWTAANLSARTATKLTDTLDGAPATHRVLQAIPNLQLNHATHVRIGAPAGSGVGRYVAVVVDGGFIVGLTIDTQTGTFLNSPAGITNKTFVNGVVDFDYTTANSADIWLCTSNGATTSYQGDGTRTATFGDNGSGDYITVTQRNVSAWADQSGFGHNAVQATGTKMPLYVSSAVNGLSAVQGDAVNDRIIANWSQAQPTTTFIVHSGATPAVNETVLDGGGGVINTLRLYGASPWKFYDGGGVDATKAWSAGWHVRTLGAYGAGAGNLQHSVDGSAPATQTSAGTAGNGVCLFSAGDDRFYSDEQVVEVIQYNRALSAVERLTVERYLGARYGVTVA